MMRSHHYKLGENQLNYETTANRVEHINRTLEPDRSPERTIEEARLDLAKHHFDFGHEDGTRTTTNQRSFDKKVFFHQFDELQIFKYGFGTRQNSRANLNKINLGEGMSPPMHTTTQAEFK